MEEINTSEETMEVAEPSEEVEAVETGEEEQEIAEPVSEISDGKTEQDSAFAEMRRSREEAERRAEELEEKIAEMEAKQNARKTALSSISGSEYDDDMYTSALANYLGVDEEDIETAIEQAEANAYREKKTAELLAERDFYKEEMEKVYAEKQFASDIAKIREVFPTESADIKSFEDLDGAIGEYKKANPDLSAEKAFGIYLSMKERTEPRPAQEIGKLGRTPDGSGFVTREQVEAMSEEEQLAKADLILESSKKWR